MTINSDELPAPGQPEPSIQVEPQDSPVPFADVTCTPPGDIVEVPQADPLVPQVPGAADTPVRTNRNYFSSARPKTVVEEPEKVWKPGPGVPFTHTEVQLALNLRGQGMSFVEIATRLNRSKEGVRQILLDWEPTQELAKATLKRGAVTLADRIIAQADVPAALEVLDRLDVLPKRDKGTDNRVQVVIGMNVDAFAPPTVTVIEEP